MICDRAEGRKDMSLEQSTSTLLFSFDWISASPVSIEKGALSPEF